jgi:nitrogen fixation NifU-like protein
MLDELRELYQDVILDHGTNPRNLRRIEDANHSAHGHNPMCGDTLQVYLKTNGQGIIEDVSFVGKGCAISMASASMMTEILKGKSVREAEVLFDGFHRLCTEDDADLSEAIETDEDAVDRLQVLAGVREFPVRVKCATLAWHTLDAAVHDKEEITTE